MWSRFRNIRTVLFSTYSLIIAVVFTVLVLWFYHWASGLLRQNAADVLVSASQSMQERIDEEIRKMNDVSLDVMYSNLIKYRFKQYTSEDTDAAADGGTAQASPNADWYTAGQAQSARELAEILTAVIGPSRPVEQIYLYDFTGNVFGNGFDNGERSYQPSEMPWFERVMTNTQGKYINPPMPDHVMSRYISSSETQYSLSLFRLFYDHYNVPVGIVEVKQYYNRIFRSVIEFSATSVYQEKMVVYDRDGRIIYPLEADADADAYAPYLKLPDGESSLVHPVTGERELVSSRYSDMTGWHTAVIVSEQRLLEPLSAFARKTVLAALAILLLAVVLSYAAAKRITYPIAKIHRAIRNTRLEDIGTSPAPLRELNSGLTELDQLYGAYVHMNSRLKLSMDELLLAQSQELQAKLVALQSQMNPHFLYNTLATIQVMAEEHMNEQIVEMSANMSDFLRYLTSDQSLVPLELELKHTENYLDINRIRHGSKLRYEIAVDDRIRSLPIPKLIVQPLVENALKFSTRGAPPWTIRIDGKAEVESGLWTVSVSDDGAGFDEDGLQRVAERIREVDRTGVIPALKLDGMGLLNIYIRMKLTYGEQTVFRLENKPGGGAVVTVGGTLPMNG